MALKLSFRPKLVDTLEGYGRDQLTRDIAAGLTVGVVALPLAMAFAIASGLKPQAGLFTAIIAGFLISALGGSRVQIGGPAGAFIVIVYGIVVRYGLPNLIIATAMSGVMLFALGLFRLGTLIRFIPIAVVIGFTNGIAVLIGLSQVKDFMGLRVSDMPADFFGIAATLWRSVGTINPDAVGVATGSLALILLWERARRRLAAGSPRLALLASVPGSVLAMVLASAVVHALTIPVETIGSRFGGIPAALPVFELPAFDWATVKFLLIPATTLALLGAIESLLCARVADGLIHDRHDPNQELMAQGIANFVTPFFGGMPATGTIARTVTNVKTGAASPISGMIHALTLLVVILVAAPLADAIPLACLSAVLLHVAWNMGQWRAFVELRQFRMPYRFTLLAVFLLTVVLDLTVAVEVGLIAACITFIYRISSLSRCERLSDGDLGPDIVPGQVAGYRLYGALFFGAVKLVEAIGDNLPARTLVLDLKNLIYVDSSGADTLMELAQACKERDVRLFLSGLNHQPLDIARRCGLLALIPADDLCPDLSTALAQAQAVTRRS